MKKSLLSFFIVFVFTFYVVTTRMEDFNIVPVSADKKDDSSAPSESRDTTPPKSTPDPEPVAGKPPAAPVKKPISKASVPSPAPVIVSPEPTPPSPSPSATPPATSPSETVPPSTATVTPPAPKPAGMYKDGRYTGSVADAYYGYIQVEAVIRGGKIENINFLQYPNDRSTSIEINTQAMPFLKTEAIQAQSANVDIVSGATDSSIAFRESLGVALQSAKN